MTDIYLLKYFCEENIGKVKSLLKQGGVNLNYSNNFLRNTALHLASRDGYIDIVQLLKQKLYQTCQKLIIS